MKSNKPERELRSILILKLDAQRLYDRITLRFDEYMTVFAVKRTREHFRSIFKTRYWSFTPHELSSCGDDTIILVDQFYEEVDQMKWYLEHTEDMPQSVEDQLSRMIKSLKKHYTQMMLYLDAELGVESDEVADQFNL